MRLHDNFGTCRTLDKVKKGETFISPTPAMAEKEPSAILTFLFPAHGL